MQRVVMIMLAALLWQGLAPGWLSAADEPVQHEIGNPQADWHLKVTLNKPDGVYPIGERLSLTVEAPRKCHVHILNVDSDGDVTVLWPIEAGNSNLVMPGETIQFPDPVRHPRVSFVAKAPVGKELLVCLATQEPINLKDPAQAKKFAEFLASVQKVSPKPLNRLKSFVTMVEPEANGWTAKAVEIRTVCP